MKVYGWQGMRHDQGRRVDTREIVAAPSKAAAARTVGERDPRRLFNFDETRNPEAITIAMREPGVVFWYPLNEPRPLREWRRVAPEATEVTKV